MKKMILRRYFMLMAVLTLIISSVNVQNVDASNSKRHEYWWIVRRHIVGGTYRTLISVQNPLRLCRTGICRSLSAG